MEEKIQALAQEIINKIEQCKAQINYEKLNKRKEEYGNPMHTGWCTRWFVGLYSKTQTMKVSASWCPYIMIDGDELDEEPMQSDISGIFEVEQHRQRLQELLQQWFVPEVENQEYGGFYTEEVTLSVWPDTTEFDDSLVLKHKSEKRWTQLLDNLRSFAVQKDYETASIERLCLDMKRIVFLLMHELYPELGLAKLMEVVDTLIQRCQPEEDSTQLDDIAYGARKALFKRDQSIRDTPEQMDLVCYICIIMIQSGQNYADILQDLAKEHKHKWAKDILKFGSGKFNRDDTVLKSELVECTANDVTRVVTVKFKEESTAAYNTVLEFFTQLIGIGFPQEYRISSNQKSKDILPVRGLKKTTSNKFWNSCRTFPDCFPAIEKYVSRTLENRMSSFTYYGDAEEANSVSVGGYAAFVLGLESNKHFDTVRAYMQQTDTEHNLTADLFANAFIQKWGVTGGSALAVADCLLGSNGHWLNYELDLSGFDDIASLTQLAQYMQELKSHKAERLVGLIWGGTDELEPIAKAAGEEKKPLYQCILAAMA